MGGTGNTFPTARDSDPPCIVTRPETFVDAAPGDRRITVVVADGVARGGVLLACFATGVPYANVQEYGALIKPTGGRKFLTIPIEDNLTRAGVPKYASAKAFMEQFGPKGKDEKRFSQGRGSAAGTRIAAAAQARSSGAHAFVWTSKSGAKYIVLQQPDRKSVV